MLLDEVNHAPRRSVRFGVVIAAVALLLLGASLLWSSSRSQPTRENQEQSAAAPLTRRAARGGAVVKPIVTSTAKTSRVFGTVQDAQGNPVASARVCAIRTPLILPVPTRSCVGTGADGQYQLTLTEATWLLGASGGGFAPSDVGPGRRSGRVELKRGGAARVDFTLLQAGREIRGVVRDALGGSVAGAFVVVGGHPGISQPGAQTLSDEKGGFVLTVPMRRCGIVAYASGYFPGTARVEVEAEVELVLTPDRSGPGDLRGGLRPIRGPRSTCWAGCRSPTCPSRFMGCRLAHS